MVTAALPEFPGGVCSVMRCNGNGKESLKPAEGFQDEISSIF
jgi:hypothetical protein